MEYRPYTPVLNFVLVSRALLSRKGSPCYQSLSAVVTEFLSKSN